MVIPSKSDRMALEVTENPEVRRFSSFLFFSKYRGWRFRFVIEPDLAFQSLNSKLTTPATNVKATHVLFPPPQGPLVTWGRAYLEPYPLSPPKYSSSGKTLNWNFVGLTAALFRQTDAGTASLFHGTSCKPTEGCPGRGLRNTHCSMRNAAESSMYGSLHVILQGDALCPGPGLLSESWGSSVLILAS